MLHQVFVVGIAGLTRKIAGSSDERGDSTVGNYGSKERGVFYKHSLYLLKGILLGACLETLGNLRGELWRMHACIT